ncbi:MAG: MarR family winged helix-turn-helix transcriptional regulator [Chryseolinea sp.]
MKKAELDIILRETEHIKVRSWGKVLSYLRRQFEAWTTDELSSHGYSDFSMAHMPLIMNIKPEGTNNNELAAIAKISKQAMSKVVKDLLQKGYIETKTDAADKRSTIISLTEKGKRFVIKARYCVQALTQEYQDLLGKKEYEHMIDNLMKIMAYNEKHHNF